MDRALKTLEEKGERASSEECLAARLAILLHDVGHGPFSHSLEHSLVSGITHESISHLIIRRLSTELGGALTKAERVFSHEYPKRYLHQLVSSQLDVDRMDYLNRDSFFTGVSEGVIGYDRILNMLAVRDGDLVVEEKAVHSVEKFIIARRLMYWQVYLHKTVLGAEQLLINILRRACELAKQGAELFATPALRFFLYSKVTGEDFQRSPEPLENFCALDDTDVLASIKIWQAHEDQVLSQLCRMLVERRLYKVQLSNEPFSDELVEARRDVADKKLSVPYDALHYFVFTGTTESSTYNLADERIGVAMKDGTVRDISAVENPLVTQALARPVVKSYICSV
jgi:HD superfamily phosphohydrolase